MTVTIPILSRQHLQLHAFQLRPGDRVTFQGDTGVVAGITTKTLALRQKYLTVYFSNDIPNAVVRPSYVFEVIRIQPKGV